LSCQHHQQGRKSPSFIILRGFRSNRKRSMLRSCALGRRLSRLAVLFLRNSIACFIFVAWQPELVTLKTRLATATKSLIKTPSELRRQAESLTSAGSSCGVCICFGDSKPLQSLRQHRLPRRPETFQSCACRSSIVVSKSLTIIDPSSDRSPSMFNRRRPPIVDRRSSIAVDS
jgi:hypothetical protein